MATIKDVAKEAGVSVATVSHVINNTRYVSPELTDKVEKAMKKLGYQPDAIARSLKTEKTQTIGLIVSDISNPFFSRLLRGVEDSAIDHDHSLIVCNTDETLAKEKLYVSVLLQKKIDGLIIAPTGKTDENLKQLINKEIPFVFIDRKIEDVDADAVLSDNRGGAYEATRHLIDLGHKKIGLILGLKGVTTSKERLEGYRVALQEADIRYREDYVIRGGSSTRGGVNAVKEILSLMDRPSAIFSANNLMTLGAMKGIKEMGLECPEDISLAGFDDFEWASIFEPTLTTVAQSPYKIGENAAERLFHSLNKKGNSVEEIRIPTKLIIRNSTINS